MKREFTIGIIIAILGAALMWFIYDRYQPFTSNTKVVINNSASGQTITLTQSVISQHDTAADCWLVISGQVYNVSSYLGAHPGGVASVLPYCGQPDGTGAFATKGGRGNDHSTGAYAELKPYLLGAVNSSIATNSNTVLNNPASTANTNVVVVTNQAANQNTAVTNTGSAGGQPVTLTQSVISQHNSSSDCWLVVSGKVYNISSYLGAHPGGVASILPYCGKPDGTGAFGTKGGQGNNHSGTAYAELAQFLIGTVNGTTSTININTAQNVNIPAIRGGGEYDD